MQSRIDGNNIDNNVYPLITVVVPVRNEEKHIANTLKYIIGQDYPHDKFEIIVVDGMSSDSTVNIIKSFIGNDNRIRVIDNPKKLSSAARNIGIKEGKGEIIVFVDGHVYISNNQLLKNAAIFMERKDVSVLSRPQFLDAPSNSFFQKAVSIARTSRFGHGLDSTIFMKDDGIVDPTSSGAIYRKEVFEKVGYFDESFDAAEDIEFNYRVANKGFKAFTSMALAVFYIPRNNMSSLFQQLTRYGKGRFRFNKKHRDSISMGSLIPVLFFLGLFTLLALSMIWPSTLIAFIMYAGIYVSVNILSSIALSFKHGFSYLCVLPLIYICIHSALAWGFFSETVKSITDSLHK